MTRVYLDRSVIRLGWGGRHPVVDPDLAGAIDALQATGHVVVLVAIGPGDGLDDLTALAGVVRSAEPPVPEDPPAWFLTGERERCGERRRGLKTVLVSGGPAPRSGRGRCDDDAPDLRSAVLAVIADEAMTG
jgi:hypothetical protein